MADRVLIGGNVQAAIGVMRAASPLRYPGGKWRLAPFFERLIELNGLRGHEYVEPYAGGASLALSLLFSEAVSRIHLNDLDPAIHSFWWSVLRRTDDLLELLETTPLTLAQWRRQRAIYSDGLKSDPLALGFATLYLNRTNHSGIMNGGVIGGKSQLGLWRIDARFNKRELERRIMCIANYRSLIEIYRKDAVEFLACPSFRKEALIYLDPPYFNSGKHLYLNAYGSEDHERVHSVIEKCRWPWVVSYDNASSIRRLYKTHKSRRLSLLHTARSAHEGRELMFFSKKLKVPRVVGSAVVKRNG